MDSKKTENANGASEATHDRSETQSNLAALKNLSSLNTASDYDGRFLHDEERATYTFLHDAEVVSLHYDMSKQNLYLNGRKINSLDDHEHLMNFLCEFKKMLLQNELDANWLRSYDIEVSRLFAQDNTREEENTTEERP